MTFTDDAVISGAATLLGAFLGAMLAFVLQLLAQRRQERKADLMAAHRMLFCLLQQSNTLLLLQKDFIYPHLGDPGRFLSIPAVHSLDVTRNTFDFDTFDFMLETKRSRQVMYDLYLAQESYIEALRSLNERSRIHQNEVQPLLAKAGIRNGSEVTSLEIEQALGPHVFESIVNMTDQSLESVASAFQKLAACKSAFRGHVVEHFGTTDFTDYDFPDTFGLDGVRGPSPATRAN